MFWTGRYLAEFIGTEAFRGVYPKTWIDFVVRKIKVERSWNENPPPFHVISGCRFTNEFNAIRVELGGKMWKTIRPDAENPDHTGHSSDEEWRTLPVDATLTANTGELDWLREQADILLGEI